MNWLSINEGVNQRFVLAYNLFNSTFPAAMPGIFIPNKVIKYTRNSRHSFKVPFRRINMGGNAISYTGPTYGIASQLT